MSVIGDFYNDGMSVKQIAEMLQLERAVVQNFLDKEAGRVASKPAYNTLVIKNRDLEGELSKYKAFVRGLVAKGKITEDDIKGL
jgi:predicted transcriptional regulator